MGKLTTYMIVISGLLLLFHLGGLIDKTPNAELLTAILNPENIKEGNLGLKAIIAIEAIGLVGAVILGLRGGNVELAASSLFAVFLLNFGWDLVRVFSVLRDANEVMALLILSPIMILYVITIVEWWRGRD